MLSRIQSKRYFDMAELTAFQAARLADDVYSLTRLPTLKDAVTYLNGEYGEVFNFSEQSLLKAKTGGPWFIKCRTAFGFTLLGQGSLKGQALLLFRVTKYSADWRTYTNIRVHSSSSGPPVHLGFKNAFFTMEPTLKEIMAIVDKNNISH